MSMRGRFPTRFSNNIVPQISVHIPYALLSKNPTPLIGSTIQCCVTKRARYCYLPDTMVFHGSMPGDAPNGSNISTWIGWDQLYGRVWCSGGNIVPTI